MKSLRRMLAEFAKADKKDKNLLPKILIGAGLLGAGAFAVKGFLRNGRYVKPHLRKGGGGGNVAAQPVRTPAKSPQQAVNPMAMKTAQEVMDNHQSVLRVVVKAEHAKRYMSNQILNPEDLDDIINKASYWRVDPRNSPTPSAMKVRNTPLTDQDILRETLLEIPHTSAVSSAKMPYYIRTTYNIGNKGTVLSVKPLDDLSGLEDFNRI